MIARQTSCFLLIIVVALSVVASGKHPIANGPPFTAKVIGIVDGDTIDVLTADKTKVRIRLASIDAPERKQPFSTPAKQALATLVFNQSVTVTPNGDTHFERVIADIHLSKRHVNAWLVEQGLAWHYERFSDDKKLRKLQLTAKASRRGLWSDEHPVPPWVWRRSREKNTDR